MKTIFKHKHNFIPFETTTEEIRTLEQDDFKHRMFRNYIKTYKIKSMICTECLELKTL